MARINVYLPEDETDRWLERLESLPTVQVAHGSVIAALDAAREQLGPPASSQRPE